MNSVVFSIVRSSRCGVRPFPPAPAREAPSAAAAGPAASDCSGLVASGSDGDGDGDAPPGASTVDGSGDPSADAKGKDEEDAEDEEDEEEAADAALLTVVSLELRVPADGAAPQRSPCPRAPPRGAPAGAALVLALVAALATLVRPLPPDEARLKAGDGTAVPTDPTPHAPFTPCADADADGGVWGVEVDAPPSPRPRVRGREGA